MEFTAQGFVLGDDLSPALRELLLEHGDALKATIQPYAEITLVPQTELTPWQSKLGGTPYLPRGFAYPLSLGFEATPLKFLAQLNFAEVPPLPGFPQAGLLQFYIGSEDFYGANFGNLEDRSNFCILYFAEPETDPEQLTTDFGFLPEFDDGPLLGSAALKFTPKFAPISVVDYRFQDRVGFNLRDLDRPVIQEYYDKLGYGQGHRVGGYPGFTQEDPRACQENYRAYDCLLLQLDSQIITPESGAGLELIWGDMGIANFWVSSADLAQRDFTRVLFNWDCG